MMVWTRRQPDNLSKEELTEQLISVKTCLTSSFDDLLRQYEILSSELSVSKNCNHFSNKRTAQL